MTRRCLPLSAEKPRRWSRVLASLNHPNIAAIYDPEEIDGVRFLVLELVPGETLDEKLNGGPLPLRELLDVFRQRLYFQGGFDGGSAAFPNYDIDLDGERFVMIRSELEAAPTQLNVIQEWFAELPRRAPAPR